MRFRASIAIATAWAFLACGEDGTVSPRPPRGGGSADGGGAPDAASTDAAASDAAGGALGWETVEPISDDGAVVAEKVSYRSQGLRIFGMLCRPKAPGRYKALVLNHGGFSGVGGFNATRCAQAVRNGYVVVESSYRGEDGSDGRIEVCLGEVDDVLAMVEITRQLPYVDAQKMIMIGLSHGGCITTRAVQRGAAVQAAADVFGPKDWKANYAYWKAQRDDAGAANGVFDELMRIMREATGGTPEENPAEYDKRSPIHFVDELDAFAGAYIAVHGTKDALVLARDTCRLAAAAKGTSSYHLDRALTVVTFEPPGCEGTGVTWLAGPKPAPAWPGTRYAVVYDEAGHEVTSASGQAMLGDALTFVVAKVP